MSKHLPHVAFNLNNVGKESQKKRENIKKKKLAGQSCKGCKMNHSH